MYLPVHYQSYGAVADIFMSALRDCQGFGTLSYSVIGKNNFKNNELPEIPVCIFIQVTLF